MEKIDQEKQAVLKDIEELGKPTFDQLLEKYKEREGDNEGYSDIALDTILVDLIAEDKINNLDDTAFSIKE